MIDVVKCYFHKKSLAGLRGWFSGLIVLVGILGENRIINEQPITNQQGDSPGNRY